MADLLRTDYKDDILNTEVNTQRKYRMVQNNDGTVSFEDVTEYAQVGDGFGAADINKTNLAIDELNNALYDEITKENGLTLNAIIENVPVSFRHNGSSCDFNIDIVSSVSYAVTDWIIKDAPKASAYTLIPACMIDAQSNISLTVVGLTVDGTVNVGYPLPANTRLVASGSYKLA